MLSNDDQSRAREHGDDVDEQEEMSDTGRNCHVSVLPTVSSGNQKRNAHLTMTIVLQVKQLIGPLGDNAKGIFEESDDD